MKQITANVYVEDQYSVGPYHRYDGHRGCSYGFVTTSEGIVMVDTPMMPTDMVKWRFEIAKKGEVRYLINTDSHHDHVTGNCFFPGTVVSHEGVKESFPHVPIERTKDQIREIDPADLHLLEYYQPKEPTITFSERLNLYVGEHTFELIHLPGHQQCHIGVYVPQERVFFAGDNFTYRTQPSLAQSMPLEWVESLKKIEALDIDLVVGGHGEVGPASAVPEFRLFIQKSIDMVKDAIKQGMSKEEAASKISFEELTGSAVHPGADMQRRNVLRLYEMLSK